VSTAALAGARAATVAFLADVLDDDRHPEAVVVGLPCRITDDLVVEGCSYPWRDPDPTLIADVLVAAGLLDVPAWVLNDAELAAVAVAATLPVAARALVLTVGHGVGAAVATGRAGRRHQM
jgi:predicted NBD/HSP70 family sugar kinase